MTPRFIIILLTSVFIGILISTFLFFYLKPIISLKFYEPKEDSKIWELILESEKNDEKKLEKLLNSENDIITLEEYDRSRERIIDLDIKEREKESEIVTRRKHTDTQKGFALFYPSNYKVTRPKQGTIMLESNLDCQKVVDKICKFLRINIDVFEIGDKTAEQWLKERRELYSIDKYIEISGRNAILSFLVGTEESLYTVVNKEKMYNISFSSSVSLKTRDEILNTFTFLSFDKNNFLTQKVQEKIISLSKSVISNMRNKNVYRYAHPKKGIRFSPYAYIDVERDRVFYIGEMVNAFSQDNLYNWGNYNRSGKDIILNFRDYYNNFIYDKDYSLSTKIGYNQKIGGDSRFNFLEVYESSVFVEYYIEPSIENSWSSLILIFEEYEKEWYVIGVAHDQGII